jgi:thiamine-monophosphate kinase
VAPAARGLADDAAVVAPPLGNDLVATHDMMAEGVHFTPGCPPDDIGWKLAAVNLSDLAAMGARPLAALYGAGIGEGRDTGWAAAVARGLVACLDAHGCPLIGGDTIRQQGPTSLALTALGHLPHGTALGRGGGQAGDDLWVSGTIGDAGAGLAMALGQQPVVGALLRRYRRPTPRLALGLALRGIAHAAMDVSDGLLLDASRLAEASGLSAEIRLEAVPLASVLARTQGAAQAVRLAAATSGDDYELLFASPPDSAAAVLAAARASRTPVTPIGRLVAAGPSLVLRSADGPVPLPARLGHLHGG